MTNRTFAVDTRRPRASAARARVKKGTAFTYTLSESAGVEVTVERKSVGRRSGGRCVKQTQRNRGGKRCSLFRRVGSFTQDGNAGANTKRWLGKVGAKPLAPGSYRAAVVATDAAGNKSAPRRLSFKVVRR
jgi:hypothetical protein